MAGQNTYASGQCTWYVAGVDAWIPGGMGDASNWWSAYNGPEGGSPIVGSVAVWGPGNESANAPASSSGHVAQVTAVYGDGTFQVSEMNFNGGVGIVDSRHVTSMAGILGFLYPPGTTGSVSSSSTSPSSPAKANAGSVGSLDAASLGRSIGVTAANASTAGAGSVIAWADRHLAALLVAAVAAYMLFAPFAGGPGEAV